MEMKNIYRDVTVKELDESYIGRTVRAAGWVENIRDHGGATRIDKPTSPSRCVNRLAHFYT